MNKIHAYFLGMSAILFEMFSLASYASNLPNGFVYLRDIDPTIVQDIRYATPHNFIGSPIAGYEARTCILTRQAAQALAQVQKELLQSKLSLKVYDCYRPQRAVEEFIRWSQDPSDQKMKSEFYPRVDKAQFFDLGYVAKQSGHSRGSTMDLTIVWLGAASQHYQNGQALVSCTAPYLSRFNDGGIDMGTGFDCMDELAHNDNQAISVTAYSHRMLLKSLMEKYGFVAYQPEWWHFTLKNEPYPQTYFNFPIQSR